MKRNTKNMQTLISLLGESSLFKLLFEEEGDEETEKDAGKEEDTDTDDANEDDIFSDAEEYTDVEEDTDAEEDAEEEEEEEELPIETSIEDKIRLQDTLDDEINAIFGDFETRARKSAVLSVESLRSRSLAFLLVEESESETTSNELDLDQFASDVARLINNYSNLLDMEAIIYIKAKQFLLDKYGEDIAKQLRKVLTDRHGIDFMEDDPSLDAPLAVGASGEGGGGGGGGF